MNRSALITVDFLFLSGLVGIANTTGAQGQVPQRI
jgi:hypothetical protein